MGQDMLAFYEHLMSDLHTFSFTKLRSGSVSQDAA